MQTILIISTSEAARTKTIEERLASWHISPFDRIMLTHEAPSIGIADVRVFQKRLSLAPQQGKFVAGIISEAELLTLDAQQALLKTLEEPPANAYILLGVRDSALLLPTIISRCICITVMGPDPKEHDDWKHTVSEITTIVGSSPGQKLALLSAIGKTKEDMSLWVDRAIVSLRLQLREGGSPSYTTGLVHRLLEIKKYQGNNVNLLLLLEHAFLCVDDQKLFKKYG